MLSEDPEFAGSRTENGANANEQQNGGWTPLHEAADSGSEKLVELLLLHNADPNIADNEGITPVQTAEDTKYPSS